MMIQNEDVFDYASLKITVRRVNKASTTLDKRRIINKYIRASNGEDFDLLHQDVEFGECTDENIFGIELGYQLLMYLENIEYECSKLSSIDEQIEYLITIRESKHYDIFYLPPSFNFSYDFCYDTDEEYINYLKAKAFPIDGGYDDFYETVSFYIDRLLIKEIETPVKVKKLNHDTPKAKISDIQFVELAKALHLELDTKESQKDFVNRFAVFLGVENTDIFFNDKLQKIKKRTKSNTLYLDKLRKNIENICG